MIREKYLEAEMEVVYFLIDDVITTSGGNGGGMGEDPTPDVDL